MKTSAKNVRKRHTWQLKQLDASTRDDHGYLDRRQRTNLHTFTQGPFQISSVPWAHHATHTLWMQPFGLVSLKFPSAHSGWHYRCSVALAKHDDCLIANDNPDLWFLVILLLLVRNDLIQLIEDNTAASLGLLRTLANFFKTLNRQISFLKQTNIP